MNEIDFFVDLIGDKEVKEILKVFKETIPGNPNQNASLNSKKRHIRSIFRGQTPKMNRRRGPTSGKGHPFYIYLTKKYKASIPNIENMEAEDLFRTFQNQKNLESSYRFAQALLHFPEQTREKLEHMIRNLESGKDIFELGYKLETEEDWKNHFRKTQRYFGSQVVKELKEDIIGYFDEEIIKKMDVLNDFTKELKILDLKDNVIELEKEYPLYAIFYSFVDTHPEEDQDILIAVMLKSITNLLKINSEKIDKKQSIEEVYNKLEESLQSIEKKDQRILDLSNDIKGMRKNYTLISKEKKELEKKNSLYKNDIKKLEDQLDEYKELYVKQLKEIEKEHEKQKKELLEEKQNLTEREHNLKEQVKDVTSEDLFAVVYSLHNDLLQELYSEIPTAHFTDWKAFKNEIDQVDTLFIQRNYMTTSQFFKIKSEAKKLGIECITFNADSPKEIMDYIGYYKVKRRHVK
ncbi:hypothetical protein [Priestia megaterium]|uniref:hypothetical protein n=1 Tax=Priestia megaterium TaxID=1404 RepID=UPI001781800E|nr:hypothetical protein [Priestia megaterium]MBD8115015.1 hypothetical protein [Priestia megaterium]